MSAYGCTDRQEVWAEEESDRWKMFLLIVWAEEWVMLRFAFSSRSKDLVGLRKSL